jgi:hypothetical protein
MGSPQEEATNGKEKTSCLPTTWFGMAWVKWITHIRVIEQPFLGYWQARPTSEDDFEI